MFMSLTRLASLNSPSMSIGNRFTESFIFYFDGTGTKMKILLTEIGVLNCFSCLAQLMISLLSQIENAIHLSMLGQSALKSYVFHCLAGTFVQRTKEGRCDIHQCGPSQQPTSVSCKSSSVSTCWRG
jgi:hypothetical protein